jgi:DNA invertase Pin-like site-specific DNA recombinase
MAETHASSPLASVRALLYNARCRWLHEHGTWQVCRLLPGEHTAGRSGLGIEAQQSAVRAYLDGGRWQLIGEYNEIESGKLNDRPQLAAAIEQCKLTGATLVIAKLDRLSRDACFLLGLEKTGLDFVAADMPNANRLTVGIMAVIAQEERRMISERTKVALVAAKARGTQLGGWRATRRDGSARLPAAPVSVPQAAARAKAAAFAARVAPTAVELRAEGMSLRAIAAELTARHVATANGGQWTARAVLNLLSRA